MLRVNVNGKQIQAARLAADMSQAQLARAIGSTEKNISRWENGLNQPRIASVAAISQATGKDIDFFLTGSTEGEDDEEAAALTFDDFLRLRVKELLQAELRGAAEGEVITAEGEVIA